MSGMRDHLVYTFQFEWDQEHATQDGCGGVHGTGTYSRAINTLVLIAPAGPARNEHELAKELFKRMTKYRKGVRLLEMSTKEIDGALIEGIY